MCAVGAIKHSDRKIRGGGCGPHCTRQLPVLYQVWGKTVFWHSYYFLNATQLICLFVCACEPVRMCTCACARVCEHVGSHARTYAHTHVRLHMCVRPQCLRACLHVFVPYLHTGIVSTECKLSFNGTDSQSISDYLGYLL